MDEYQAAVRAIDTRTRQAIAAFLGAAAEVEPERVFTLSRREVVETKPGKKRAFGRRAPDEVVKSWEEEYATGHNVLGWNYEDTSDPPVRKSQALYVMTTGEMLLRGGYSFVQLTRELATNSRSGHYTRGEGALPGFLAPDQYWHEGPLVPGLPHQIEMLSQTAEWLDQRLADYLAAHPT